MLDWPYYYLCESLRNAVIWSTTSTGVRGRIRHRLVDFCYAVSRYFLHRNIDFVWITASTVAKSFAWFCIGTHYDS